jgi:hypothetical protein
MSIIISKLFSCVTYKPTMFMYMPLAPMFGSVLYMIHNNMSLNSKKLNPNDPKSYVNPGMYFGMIFSMTFVTLSSFKHIKY